MSLDKLETALKQQNQIAKNKYEAYKFLHKLVSINSKFNQVTHLMLGIQFFRLDCLKLTKFYFSFSSFCFCVAYVIGILDKVSGHYMDNIKVCSHELRKKLISSFVVIFDDILSMIKSPNLDLSSRQLALRICGISYQSQDAFLLHRSNIFPLTCELFHPTEAKLPLSSFKYDSFSYSLNLTFVRVFDFH